jgi:hypothetical protein
LIRQRTGSGAMGVIEIGVMLSAVAFAVVILTMARPQGR